MRSRNTARPAIRKACSTPSIFATCWKVRSLLAAKIEFSYGAGQTVNLLALRLQWFESISPKPLPEPFFKCLSRLAGNWTPDRIVGAPDRRYSLASTARITKSDEESSDQIQRYRGQQE